MFDHPFFFRRIIIAPSAAGKTTFAAKHDDVADVDASRNRDTEPQLRELRTQRNWEAHNNLWWPQLQMWVARLAPTITHVVAHSLADARALLTVWPYCDIVAVVPSLRTHQTRMRLRGFNGEARSLAMLNRDTVLADVASANLPLYSTFEEARLKARASPMRLQ